MLDNVDINLATKLMEEKLAAMLNGSYNVVLTDNDVNLLPECQGDAAGYDLKLAQDIEIPANSTVLAPTGVFLEIMDLNIVGKVYPRSGMSIKQGVILRNNVGIIDADYRGEIKLPLYNTKDEPIKLEKYTRVAQLVFTLIKRPKLKIVSELNSTLRGDKGFGSTGH